MHDYYVQQTAFFYFYFREEYIVVKMRIGFVFVTVIIFLNLDLVI